MSTNEDPTQLKIKKYSNRRFYDTTRSCHVTLRQMHDLIREGCELSITDGASGEDITNMVLTQIILERDAPKLDIFPSNVLHEVIRTQQNMLGSVVERFFAQVLETHKASQQQWISFIKNTIGLDLSAAPDPLAWTRNMMSALTPGSADRPESNAEMNAMRQQIEELTRQMARMNNDDRKA